MSMTKRRKARTQIRRKSTRKMKRRSRARNRKRRLNRVSRERENRKKVERLQRTRRGRSQSRKRLRLRVESKFPNIGLGRKPRSCSKNPTYCLRTRLRCDILVSYGAVIFTFI